MSIDSFPLRINCWPFLPAIFASRDCANVKVTNGFSGSDDCRGILSKKETRNAKRPDVDSDMVAVGEREAVQLQCISCID